MNPWIKIVGEKQILYINAYIWNLGNCIDELICKTEIKPRMQKTKPREQGWLEWIGRLGLTYIYIYIYYYVQNKKQTSTDCTAQEALLSALW